MGSLNRVVISGHLARDPELRYSGQGTPFCSFTLALNSAYIKEGGENRVNIRLPLSLTRTAGKFIPRQAQSYLSKYDINLSEFLEDMGQAEPGTLLEIKDGDNKVLIAVE